MRGVVNSTGEIIELIYADIKGIIHKRSLAVEIINENITLSVKSTQTFQSGGSEIQFLSVIPSDFTPGTFICHFRVSFRR